MENTNKVVQDGLEVVLDVGLYDYQGGYHPKVGDVRTAEFLVPATLYKEGFTYPVEEGEESLYLFQEEPSDTVRLVLRAWAEQEGLAEKLAEHGYKLVRLTDYPTYQELLARLS